tara:strand:- start:112063 stop:112473 length:411 start_codon:yes stop_codon:yes gene_type:complete
MNAARNAMVCIGIGVFASNLIAGDTGFSIVTYSIAGGAGVHQNANILLVGSTGQPVVAASVMGGGFSLTSGFPQSGGANPPCAADLTGDGILNFFDVSAFLGAFSAQLPEADFTGDGSFNFFDVSAFLTAFGMGCP